MRFNVTNLIRRTHLLTGYSYKNIRSCTSEISYWNQFPSELKARQILQFSASMCTKTQTNVMSGQKEGMIANVEYKDILLAQKDNNVLIIDVREQSEIDETGKLPGSIHIPKGEVTNVFKNLPEKDFIEKFQRKKPDDNTKIILSCRSGIRSAIVQQQLQKLGYENVYNYTGGWLDWQSNQK